MGVMRGGIICESLKPGTGLDDIPMVVTRWSRYEVQNVPDYQPSWFRARSSPTAAAIPRDARPPRRTADDAERQNLSSIGGSSP